MKATRIAEHAKENVIGTEEEISATAEFIFYLLYHEGEMGLEQLREKAQQ